MDHSIELGPVPARRGLEKEEPELANEEDIPADDGNAPDASPEQMGEERPVREVERE